MNTSARQTTRNTNIEILRLFFNFGSSDKCIYTEQNENGSYNTKFQQL